MNAVSFMGRYICVVHKAALDGESYLRKRFVKDQSIVTREIAGEMILVPIRSTAGELNSIYTLNEVGARIWQLVDGETTVERIRNTLYAEYEVDPEVLEEDLIQLLEQLRGIGAVGEA
jgi:hypothetical protein